MFSFLFFSHFLLFHITLSVVIISLSLSPSIFLSLSLLLVLNLSSSGFLPPFLHHSTLRIVVDDAANKERARGREREEERISKNNFLLQLGRISEFFFFSR
jgi:hypothetical protein